MRERDTSPVRNIHRDLVAQVSSLPKLPRPAASPLLQSSEKQIAPGEDTPTSFRAEDTVSTMSVATSVAALNKDARDKRNNKEMGATGNSPDAKNGRRNLI